MPVATKPDEKGFLMAADPGLSRSRVKIPKVNSACFIKYVFSKESRAVTGIYEAKGPLGLLKGERSRGVESRFPTNGEMTCLVLLQHALNFHCTCQT